jgi:hypothetical protein
MITINWFLQPSLQPRGSLLPNRTFPDQRKKNWNYDRAFAAIIRLYYLESVPWTMYFDRIVHYMGLRASVIWITRITWLCETFCRRLALVIWLANVGIGFMWGPQWKNSYRFRLLWSGGAWSPDFATSNK